MPRVDYFKATSAYAVKKHLESSRLADTAYVQLAVPLAPEAAPYVLFYVGTDNKFSHDDVRRRWKTTKRLLKNEGIKVIGFASDGDPKLLKAMLNETSFLSRLQRSKWGPFFIVNNIPLEHVYIQDIIHLLNKIRNKLLNSKELKFGILTINKDHLQLLINTISKDKHGLNDTDASTKDRMKFDPTWRIMQKDVRDCLEEFVPGSEGTVMLLQLMSQIYEAYCEINLVPLERIFKICMKELGERLRNAFMKSQISYRRKNDLKFNNIIRKQNKYPNPPHPMPTDDEHIYEQSLVPVSQDRSPVRGGWHHQETGTGKEKLPSRYRRTFVVSLATVLTLCGRISFPGLPLYVSSV
ncbi:hypothetical protein pipiens_006282 [Culex pipiens pipiens]|uniref:Uncharacterized protein n=1 Tax=Culex pipiens pipiens TaxID=38569 RepID=A0ABD1DQZ4_CULPP